MVIKTYSLFLLSFFFIISANAQSNPPEVFEDFMGYIQSCQNLKVLRAFRETSKAEADQTNLSTVQSFLPKIRYGKYERDNTNQFDLVDVLQISGNVPLSEVLYGSKISNLESKVETLDSNIKIYDGLSLLINGFFKWRSLYLMKSEIESINKYFERVKYNSKGKLSFSELSKRTDAILIRSKLSSYEAQIAFYEKVFSTCTKKPDLKDPWLIAIDPSKVPSDLWNKSIDQQSKLRKSIERSHCQAKSELLSLKMDKERSLWYPKFFYAWAQETNSKIFPDREGWSFGLEVSVPWFEKQKPTHIVDSCHLSLQEDDIRESSNIDSIKKQTEELAELILLRNRWGEVIKETLGAFKLQGEGPKMMSSAISQFEHLNLQVSEIETSLVMASTFKETK